jgi:hypothetical protein
MEYEEEESASSSVAQQCAPSVEEILMQVADQVGDTFFGAAYLAARTRTHAMHTDTETKTRHTKRN